MAHKKYTSEEEILWLIKNPHFRERPATIEEFIESPQYLNLSGGKVRPGVKRALEEIFGDDVDGDNLSMFNRAMFTGAIGVGKTTFASIALPYMVHWVLCLRDPQGFFGLLPGSRIAFMQMSTSENHAREVIFGDIKARVDASPWFRNKFPYDQKHTKSIRWPDNDVWILPGDSQETTFEGYNILGGILDEADSHKLTKEKDYAEVGYDTIEGRIQSRFVDNRPGAKGGHRGLAIIIGQMKKTNGFAHKKYTEFLDDPQAKVIRMTIWESFGWDTPAYLNPDGTRNSFWYDIKRRTIVPTWIGSAAQDENVIEIPNSYLNDFKIRPEKALKDLAGIPPEAADPFIGMTYKLEEAKARWEERYPGLVPVGVSCTQPEIAEWVGDLNHTDARRRVGHIDIAYSAEGDSASVAIGHVEELVENSDGELKPYIIMDLLYRRRAPEGGEIQIADLRSVIYLMKARGMRIDKVTLDGFQSTDTMQQFRKKKIRSDYLSMDRSKLAYEDLREAIYEDRIEWPPYMTFLTPGNGEQVDILYRELSGLSDTGQKIDHPSGGSKDLADSVAGVVCTLMGDNTYKKGLASPERRDKDTSGPQKSPQQVMD
ncbi:MAG: hypothetical protein EOO77_21245, partial [Oxalobacteraceae bacterium]